MKVYMLLDASGSMSTSWDEMIGSINKYVEGLPAKSEIMLSAFDYVGDMNYRVLRNTDVRSWKNITKEDAMPGGTTPLIDASARMLHHMIDDGNDRAVFVLITDGHENASRHFKKPEVVKLLETVKRKDWQVVFIGANFDEVSDVGSSLGLQSSSFLNMSTVNYTPTMEKLASKTTRYATAGADISYNKAEKAEAVK